MKSLEKYLSRIGLSMPAAQGEDKPTFVLDRATLKTLAIVMTCQSRCIPFENIDVVLGKQISMSPADVEKKLVDDIRGGYCWEQNTLLRMALEEMGYEVTPLMCRVRWGKAEDNEEPNTPYTHLALKVRVLQTPEMEQDGNGEPKSISMWNYFLADVGFAGTNSMNPVNLGIGSKPQDLPEGRFRVVPSKHKDFHVLQLQVSHDPDQWRPLYEWRDESAPWVDQECSNWFSCTHPTARFTNQMFICRIVGEDERHHILNDQYVIRKGHGVNKDVTSEQITDLERLLSLVDEVFMIKLDGVDTKGIDRYLS
jgi:N-hydroxyarylamine O-acetyltransferase